MTLVELLVVLGVIAILTAVVVPLAGFYYDERGQDRGARELFAKLRAAEVYAATYNVRCAVVPNIRVVNDSVTGASRLVITDLLVARELTRKELDALTPRLLDARIRRPNPGLNLAPIFVPLASRSGQFEELPGGACVLGETFETTEVELEDGTTDDVLLSSSGLSRIRLLYSVDDLSVIEVSAQPLLQDPLASVLRQHVPAYVWEPDGGLMLADDYTKARVTVYVAMLPDADPSERFLLDPETGEPRLDRHGDPIELVTPIEIYHAVGRVRIGQGQGLDRQ